MAPALVITDLSKYFDEITAVSNLSLTADRGEIIALLGPNGAGKSTLMNDMISGYLTPSAGQIKISGLDLATDTLTAKKQIGFLPEGAPLYGDMSVQSFIRYIAGLKSLPHTEADRVIKIAHIDNVAGQKIETLSKGYKRRVGFAASLLGDPPLLLLDEPTDGLDPNQKDHMLRLIREMRKDKMILISTHLLDEAETIASRILIMDKGQIRVDGSLQSVLLQTSSLSLEKAFVKLTGATRHD